MKKDLYNKIFAPSDCLSQKMLIGYLKGTLNEQDTHRTEEHLVDCELCSEALDGLTLLKSESVLDKVSADIKKVAQDKGNRKRIAPLGIWMAAAATVIIIIASVVSVSVLTNVNENQLALKSPVLSDSLIKRTAKTNQNVAGKEDTIEENFSGNIAETEKSLIPQEENNKTISTPSQPEEVASLNESVEVSDDLKEHEVIQNNIAYESDIKETSDMGRQSDNVNSSATISAPAKAEIQSVTKSKSLSTTTSEIKNNSNLISFVHDLKIIDYNQINKNEIILEPEIKHTEAQFATPDEKAKSTADAGMNITYKEKISPALKAFKDENYTLAIGFFNNLLIENHNDYNALFYSGMSYFQLENYMKAREFFQKLNENNNHTFYEETKYYLALSHLNLGNKIQAKNLLEEVIKINSFYKSRAQNQLKNTID